jgi:thiol-disulfide isomerase/thioredoxin
MGKNTKRMVFILLVTALLPFAGVSFGAESVTAIGHEHMTPGVSSAKTSFPLFELPIPESDLYKDYLGLSGTGKFNIGQIKTQVLLFEVYSFYCPICQKSAAHVNELYQMIEQNPGLKDKVKMVGIAVTNSAYEVNAYRERYKVLFPLFPDKDLDIAKNLAVRGTPTFIGVKMNEGGGATRFLFSEGGFDNVQKFLDELIKLSGLN